MQGLGSLNLLSFDLCKSPVSFRDMVAIGFELQRWVMNFVCPSKPQTKIGVIVPLK